jgi:carbonic anhydrase
MNHGIAHEEYHRGRLALYARLLGASRRSRGSFQEVEMTRKTYLPALAAPVALLVAALAISQVQTKESQMAMTPEAALQRLKDGNTRFVSGQRMSRDWSAKVIATATGQYPYAAVLSCIDSRAPVEIVLDQGIGDVFVLRSAGNVVDTDALGGLEFATKVSGAKQIVVLGHTECGAVKGAIDGVKMGNLTALLAKIQSAVRDSGPGNSKEAAYVTKVTEQNVRDSMHEIRERSQILRELIDSGKVGLVGGMYDVATGKVTFFAN